MSRINIDPKRFSVNNQTILELVELWVPKLLVLENEVIADRRNRQNRTIKQLVGHMIDSASNNTHRIIHLQYQPTPLIFPDYANLGNNDRWIAIQNYQAEDWTNLVQLWKYAHLHIVHVIEQVDLSKLSNEWLSALGNKVSLEAMIVDYTRHFKLHLSEIDELLNKI